MILLVNECLEREALGHDSDLGTERAQSDADGLEEDGKEDLNGGKGNNADREDIGAKGTNEMGGYISQRPWGEREAENLHDGTNAELEVNVNSSTAADNDDKDLEDSLKNMGHYCSLPYKEENCLR